MSTLPNYNTLKYANNIRIFQCIDMEINCQICQELNVIFYIFKNILSEWNGPNCSCSSSIEKSAITIIVTLLFCTYRLFLGIFIISAF